MIGQTISHYRILEKLGEGGMGVVYKAEDIRLHRPVAVKFLPLGKRASKDQTDRFIHEAQAAAALSHPNIATVFELDEVEDTLTHTTQAFIAMEYVEGETLEEIVRGGPLPADRVRNIAIQIAQGLLNAHQQGTIHRDIKPSNVIINREGVVKLLDFGLAKLAQDTTIGEKSTIAGSAAYMSPEQAQGEKLDLRTDIWSFGVVLYQMLSGRLPFRGEHAPALMYSIVNEEALPLKAIRSDTPDDLVAICQRCLQKNRDSRPQGAGEILEILGSTRPVFRQWSLGKRFALFTQEPTARWVGVFSLLLIVAVIVWYIFTSPTQPTIPSEVKRWRLAVMPFENLTKKAESDDWHEIIPAMMIHELTGVPYLGILDYSGSDGYRIQEADSVSNIISGKILPAQIGFLGGAYLVDVKSGEISTTYEQEIRGELELPEVIRGSAEHILGYFEINILEAGKGDDLRGWHSARLQNPAAVRAFLQASNLIFRDMPGVEEILYRAIELDSTFISPRVWLISRLTNQGRAEEAQDQLPALEKFGPSASPFEHAMIGWAKARLANDLPEQRKSLQLALQYLPGNKILIANLAMNHFRQNDYEGTINVLKPLLAAHWEYPPIYALAGLCLMKTGKYSESKTLLERSLDVTPVFPKVYSMLAALSSREGKTSEFQRYEEHFLNKFKDQKASPARAYEEMGLDFYETGQSERARQYFEKSLQLDSTSTKASMLREFLRTIN